MSVKSKVKRCNKEIIRLEEQLETERLSNRRLKMKLDEQIQSQIYIEHLENIVKFALTNHIGNLKGGMRIEAFGIDKMKELKLVLDYEPQFNSYVIKVNY